MFRIGEGGYLCLSLGPGGRRIGSCGTIPAGPLRVAIHPKYGAPAAGSPRTRQKGLAVRHTEPTRGKPNLLAIPAMCGTQV